MTKALHNPIGSLASGECVRIAPKIPLILFTLWVAFASMANELILAQCATSIYGGALLHYSTMIGLFIGSLGMGAAIVAWNPRTPSFKRLWLIEMGLASLSTFAPMTIFLAAPLGTSAQSSALDLGPILFWALKNSCFILCCLAAVLIGFFSGMELPIMIELVPKIKLSHPLEDRPPHSDIPNAAPKTVRWLIGLDFVGTFAAAMTVPLAFFSWFGLMGAAALCGIFSGISACAPLIWGQDHSRWRWSLTGLMIVWALGLFLWRVPVAEYLGNYAFRL